MCGQGPEKTRRGSRKSGRGTQGGCSGLNAINVALAVCSFLVYDVKVICTDRFMGSARMSSQQQHVATATILFLAALTIIFCPLPLL